MNDTTNELLKDATNANPDNNEPETTENIDTSVASTDIDYKKKFSESSKEALRIREENIRLANELESLKNSSNTESNGATYSDNTEQIIPGFDMMTEDEQKNLLAYTDSIRRSTLDAIYKDPAIADAKNKYNENVWESSFNEVSTKFPKLKEFKEQFKTEYFRPNQNPSNLEELMTKGAKEFLYDHVEEIAVRKALEKADRLDIERSSGGNKTPVQERSDEDWFRLSQDNPVKFSEEYRKSQKK